jgi:hypothetical protein
VSSPIIWPMTVVWVAETPPDPEIGNTFRITVAAQSLVAGVRAAQLTLKPLPGAVVVWAKAGTANVANKTTNITDQERYMTSSRD